MCVLGFLGLACCGGGRGGGGGNLCVQFFTLYSPTIKKFGKNHTWCAKYVLGIVYAVSTVFKHCMAWRGFTCGGEGGLIEALRPDPPPKQRAQLTGPPKTDPGPSVVPMAVVFVFKDTRSPVNSGYTCM